MDKQQVENMKNKSHLFEIKIHVFFSAFTYLGVWSESLACNKYFDLHQSIKSQVTINPGAMVKSRLIAVDKKQCIADKPVRKYQLGCGVSS